MTYPTGALGSGFGIQGQFSLTEQFGQGGQPLTDLMARCRGHHHHHHGGSSAGQGPSGEQQNGPLADLEGLAGELENSNNPREQQLGAALANFAQSMQGGQTNGMGGQDPCMNGMGNQGFGMNGMGGQDPCMGGMGMGNQGAWMGGMGNQGSWMGGSPFPTGGNGNNGSGDNCGCGGMSVNTANNTITVGDYTITASPDKSGKLDITNNCTGKTDEVWGDPHISTADGGTADFQHNNATIALPNGALVNIKPTANPTGPNTMQQVTVTYGNHAAQFNFSNGQVQTQDMPGQGYALDETTPGGVRMDASPNGQLAVETGTGEVPITQGTGNIDQYATNGPMGFGNGNFGIGNGNFGNGDAWDPFPNANFASTNAQLDSIMQQAEQDIEQILGNATMANFC